MTNEQLEFAARELAEQLADASPSASEEIVRRVLTPMTAEGADAILDRAGAMLRDLAARQMAEADALENLLRLARAAGMPEGGKPLPWLLDRGLAEEGPDGHFRIRSGGRPKCAPITGAGAVQHAEESA